MSAILETPETAVAEETEKTEFRILAGKMEYLRERFKKIATRAKRVGCDAPTFEIIGVEDVKDEESGRVTRFNIIRLIGENPVLAGHRFIGTLEHNSEIGIIVRAVPGYSIPVQYRTADPTNCDHCHKRIITRRETFIVEHIETGVFKQVGRQCVADFLGGTDPKAVLAFAEMFIACREMLEAGEDEDERCYGGEGRAAQLFDTIHVLALTAALCRNIGWTPRSKRTDFGPVPTADSVASYMVERDKTRLFRNGKTGYIDYKEMAKYEVAERDTATAEAAIEWARELGADGAELNDYLYNISLMAKAGALEIKHFGLACSIVSAYNREQERLLAAERAQREPSTLVHIGVEKKRAEFVLTVTRYSTTEGQYGVTHIFAFEDEAGNKAVWFGSNDQGMELGHTYKVKATVKQHGQYGNQAQTVLSRVTLIEEIVKTGE